jgi:hypothetical protein
VANWTTNKQASKQTNKQTPQSRVLLEKLTIPWLVNKFPTLYGNRQFINPLLPNVPQLGRAVSPLNMAKDRTTHRGVANSVSHLEAFFSPLSQVLLMIYTRQVPWRPGLVCGLRITPPPPLKPLQKPWFRRQHFWTVHLCSRHSIVCLSLALESSVACISTVSYGTSTNWWAERFSVAYCNAYCSDETNIQKLEISMKINVYSYRWAHRRVSSSYGALFRGCGAVMCNTQPSNILKMLWATLKSRNFTQHSHRSFRSVLFSPYKEPL